VPLIECYLNEMTDDLALKLEKEITASIREAVAQAFPPELGFAPGTPEFQVGVEVSRKIMPGWTWVSVSQLKWAIQGKRINNAIAARIHILVLENALEPRYKDSILQVVTGTVKKILSASGKQVHLAVSITEGGVDMTLPRELFEGLTHGSPEELLQVKDVSEFLRSEINKELQARKNLVG
jgi:hypothetical protein